MPHIKNGERVLIAAHGNSLRALIMYLENLTEQEIMTLNLPTGIPLLYELSDDLKVIAKEYIGDPESIAREMEKVANQGKRAN